MIFRSGSGTLSGPLPEQAGSLLELTHGGKQPLTLANGETRTFLEDGDSVVLDVYLGDGMWVRDRHIRLADVHAYEMGTDTGVKERDYLRNLIPDKDAVLVVEMHGRDKYGRLLGVIWCDGVNINERMLKQPQGGR